MQPTDRMITMLPQMLQTSQVALPLMRGGSGRLVLTVA